MRTIGLSIAALVLVGVGVGCAADASAPVASLPSTPVRAHADAAPLPPFELPATAFQSSEAARDDGVAESTPVDSRDPARARRYDTTRIVDAADSRPRFHGAAVDLDVKNADIHDLCRLLAEVGHVNIVVASEAQGSVTVRLRHVPWDQALDVIVRARGLAIEREDDVILVRPLVAAK